MEDVMAFLKETFQTINLLSREIDLIIRPHKCVTPVFDGKKVLKNHRIELTNGWMRLVQPPISPQIQKLRNNWNADKYEENMKF